MPDYLVATPTYKQKINLGAFGPGDGSGPIEKVRDVVEVTAEDEDQAKVMAVRRMREKGMRWVEDRRVDGRTPFAGLEVTRIDVPEEKRDEWGRTYPEGG